MFSVNTHISLSKRLFNLGDPAPKHQEWTVSHKVVHRWAYDLSHWWQASSELCWNFLDKLHSLPIELKKLPSYKPEVTMVFISAT